MTVTVSGYTVAIAGAEVSVVYWGAIPGTLWHALVILAALNHYIYLSQAPDNPYADPNSAHWFSDVLPVLALAPLLRILSLTMPINSTPQIYWYAMIGAPLLIAVALAARLLNLSWAAVGLPLQSWRAQLVIACSGLPLGLVAFLILRPNRLVASSDWRDVVIGVAVLAIFTGFTEEIIFRGLLQRIANEIFGRAGVLWSSILFASMYIGSLSLSYALFIGLVGLFFGWCVNRTGSILGVAIAHSLLAIGMILLWPSILY